MIILRHVNILFCACALSKICSDEIANLKNNGLELSPGRHCLLIHVILYTYAKQFLIPYQCNFQWNANRGGNGLTHHLKSCMVRKWERIVHIGRGLWQWGCQWLFYFLYLNLHINYNQCYTHYILKQWKQIKVNIYNKCFK